MPRDLRLKWSFGNTKISKLDAVSFGVPAYRSASGFKTCPKAGACAAVCYARQGSYTWSTVQTAREANLRRIRADIRGFVRDALQDLQRIRARYVRVHDSGDFFSQAYLDAWSRIAREFPDKTFYAYTKSLHLDFNACPENLRITQSEGGKLDGQINRRRPHSRIFATHADRKRAGYLDGSRTDRPAITGKVKIGLVYHGTRKLAEAQRKYFK